MFFLECLLHNCYHDFGVGFSKRSYGIKISEIGPCGLVEVTSCILYRYTMLYMNYGGMTGFLQYKTNIDKQLDTAVTMVFTLDGNSRHIAHK